MGGASNNVDCSLYANWQWQIWVKSPVERAKVNCGLTESDPSWWSDNRTLEKMGALMAENHWKVLGLYNELQLFLSKMLQGRSSLSDSA